LTVGKKTVKDIMDKKGFLFKETKDFLHYQVLTPFFGFPDDGLFLFFIFILFWKFELFFFFKKKNKIISLD